VWTFADFVVGLRAAAPVRAVRRATAPRLHSTAAKSERAGTATMLTAAEISRASSFAEQESHAVRSSELCEPSALGNGRTRERKDDRNVCYHSRL
jgi:hypothetical protein